MANQLSRGSVWAGEYETKYGQVAHTIVGQIARSNTAAKILGQVPAGATITAVKYIGQTASDAGTTAVLDAGYSDGTGKELVNDANLKSAGTGSNAGATGQQGGTLAAAHTITGKYAETGSASTTGGPWTVVVEFVTNIVK